MSFEDTSILRMSLVRCLDSITEKMVSIIIFFIDPNFFGNIDCGEIFKGRLISTKGTLIIRRVSCDDSITSLTDVGRSRMTKYAIFEILICHSYLPFHILTIILGIFRDIDYRNDDTTRWDDDICRATSIPLIEMIDPIY